MKCKQLVPVLFSLAAMLCTVTAKADAITLDFSFDIIGGTLDGTAQSGRYAYDPAAVAGSGSEFVTPVSVYFPFNGYTFALADDLNATVDFFDGVLLGLTYNANSASPAQSVSFQSGFADVTEQSFLYSIAGTPQGGADGIDNLITTTVFVPEPGTIWTMPLLLAWILRRRGRKAGNGSAGPEALRMEVNPQTSGEGTGYEPINPPPADSLPPNLPPSRGGLSTTALWFDLRGKLLKCVVLVVVVVVAQLLQGCADHLFGVHDHYRKFTVKDDNLLFYVDKKYVLMEKIPDTQTFTFTFYDWANIQAVSDIKIEGCANITGTDSLGLKIILVKATFTKDLYNRKFTCTVQNVLPYVEAFAKLDPLLTVSGLPKPFFNDTPFPVLVTNTPLTTDESLEPSTVSGKLSTAIDITSQILRYPSNFPFSIQWLDLGYPDGNTVNYDIPNPQIWRIIEVKTSVTMICNGNADTCNWSLIDTNNNSASLFFVASDCNFPSGSDSGSCSKTLALTSTNKGNLGLVAIPVPTGQSLANCPDPVGAPENVPSGLPGLPAGQSYVYCRLNLDKAALEGIGKNPSWFKPSTSNPQAWELHPKQ